MEADDDFPGGRWAKGLAATCLFLFGFAALTAGIDRLNRDRDETVSKPTAVADPVTLKPDPRGNPGKEVLRWKAQPYFLQTNDPVRIPDTDVLKLGKDDKGTVELYRSKTPEDPRLVLVKIAPDEFLVLAAR